MIYAAAITGPTASGKTALSVRVAKALGATVLCADSMQIYKEMCIGTAKVTPEEMEGVPHLMLDVASVTEDFSVHSYKETAIPLAREIARGGHLPLFVGGTGLYLAAMTRGDEDTPGRSEEYMRRYEALAATEEGKEALHRRLSEIDPESAALIHKNNVRRVLRALEIYDTTGKTKTEHDRESRAAQGALSLLHISLDFHSRDLLYDRIDRRVKIMMREGLLGEAKSLYERGLLSTDTAAMGAIGYKEFLPYFRGECTLSEVEAAIALGTRRYAKRQQTWFRRLPDVKTVYMDDGAGRMRDPDAVFSEVMDLLSPFVRLHYNDQAGERKE
ncbi:MAG: tRNA (adenosine(37)-N6)-dimethylallyltransferase MiaA [Clostridia bacterium]|nr:tRNA (adenosine(37)-N6)-dimethylallyltransferase MiaA [Clostridia bacterium]